MIRKISSLLIISLVVAPWLHAQERPVAFVDVTVVPMDKEQILPHQTVVVEGGRITQVASATSSDPSLRTGIPASASKQLRARKPSFGIAVRTQWSNDAPKHVGRCRH